MNKKNITINTEFFDDGLQAKLKAYHTDDVMTDSGRKSQTMVEHYRRASYDSGIPNPRYEYVPDNQYSTNYQVYEMPPQSIKKFQAANSFQNIISRAMANLFVRCWEQMKALLPQYLHLVEQVQQNQPKKINQQVLEDYNNVFNINSSKVEENVEVQTTNVFSKKNEYLDERKNQIIERQRKGLTLDSLSKQKLNRSKSIKKEEGKIKTQQNKKNQRLVQSRKSYRQKFLDYKHRSKSRDLGLQKSLTYTKFSSNIPQQRHPIQTSYDTTGQYPNTNHVSNNLKNFHSASNLASSKNQILRNIKDLLIDRQDIYQGKNYNYYVNHRDSSRNMFSYQPQYYNEPLNSFDKMNYGRSLEINYHKNQQEEMIRTQLIQQIVQKLNFSKLRLEEIQKPKNKQQQIMKRIDKIQKLILNLKEQEKVQYNRPQEYHQIFHHKIQDHSYKQSSQNLQNYKRFVDEIASLRSQIKEIRNIRNFQPQSIIKNDNQSSHIIAEQQKLLSSQSHEFQKLISEREKVIVLTQKELQVAQTAKKSLFDQLIENDKNSQKKVTWNQGWQTSHTNRKLQEQNINQQRNQTNQQQTIRKSRRTQHFERDQGFQNYRYTRNQVLQNIGLKSQIQEQQRLWREQQARMKLERQKRDEEVRLMVENVRRQRNQDIGKSKSTREIYEQQWQRYHKIHMDSKQSSGPFCSFFNC